MAKIAFLFSGQGAQYTGMGEDLYQKSSAAKDLLDDMETIHPGLIHLCFKATNDELKLTSNTQPAVYAVDLAAAAAITQEGITPCCVAGFSLGELAAVAFSGILTTRQALVLVQKRAALMTAAAEKNPGAMLAVLRMENQEVENLCSNRKLYPVNYNCPGQLVVAGSETDIDYLQENVKRAGGRSIRLAVSGGFHSPFMDEAAQGFGSELKGVELQKPRLPVYSNVTGDVYKDNVHELLTKQINHPVRWEKIIRAMDHAGVDCFIELGPGKVLSGLVLKILPQALVFNVETSEDIKRIKEEMIDAKK